MFNIERWQEIFEAISKNKLRTFLTGVSVASGIFILIILLGVGQGMQNGIANVFEDDAANSIWIWTHPTSVKHQGLNPGREIAMTNEDYTMISSWNADAIEYKSSSSQLLGAKVKYQKRVRNYKVKGVYPDFQFIENVQIIDGRFINQLDVIEGRKVAIISAKIERELFPSNGQVIGQLIAVNGVNCQIVGVYKDAGGEREEDKVVIPITTMQKTFALAQKVTNIGYTLKAEENFNATLKKSKKFVASVDQYLRTRYTISPEDDLAIDISSSIEQAKRFYSLMFTIKVFFLCIGGCTSIAGVVGVSNIMLIIVKERTKEIGIRKALGAIPLSIVLLVVQEAIFITTIAGFVGLIAGLFLLELVGPFLKTDFIYNPSVDIEIALGTLMVLVFAGALAGFFPAWHAAKVKPIIALRNE